VQVVVRALGREIFKRLSSKRLVVQSAQPGLAVPQLHKSRDGRGVGIAMVVLLAVSISAVAAVARQSNDGGIKAATEAFEAGEYPKAEQLLLAAAASQPDNAELQLLLTKTHLEMQQYDAAIKSAEKGGSRSIRRAMMPARRLKARSATSW